MDEDFEWSESDGQLWMYTTKGLNYQSTWFFQNHSDTPNLDGYTRGDRDFYYIAIVILKKEKNYLKITIT